MNLAVLRATGVGADLESLRVALARATGAECEMVGRPGAGGAAGTSGLRLLVSDAENPDVLARELRAFLQACRDHGVPFNRLFVATELDIAMTVGSSSQFTASVFLSPEDLALLSELGLGVRLSAYPASADEEEP